MVHKGGMLMIHQDETDIACFFTVIAVHLIDQIFAMLTSSVLYYRYAIQHYIIAFVSSHNPSAACTEAG